MAVSGPQKLALFLARFADSEGQPPQDVVFFNDLFLTRGSGGPTTGSRRASGRKTLDATRDDFVATHPGRWDKIKGAIERLPPPSSSRSTGNGSLPTAPTRATCGTGVCPFSEG